MKNIYFLILLLPLFTAAQDTTRRYIGPPRGTSNSKPNKPFVADSAGYYQQQMAKLSNAAVDSVMRSEEYRSLQRNYRRLVAKRNNYTAFTLFTEYQHSDYSSFNNQIAASGFSPLSATTPRIGFGVSTKDDHFIFNLYFAILGLNNVSQHNGQKIKSTVNDLFYYDFGYDLLHSNTMSLYPYIGISLRSSTLRFIKDAQLNTSYTSVADMVINDQSVNTSSTNLGYHAGFGFDIKIGKHIPAGLGEGVINPI